MHLRRPSNVFWAAILLCLGCRQMQPSAMPTIAGPELTKPPAVTSIPAAVPKTNPTVIPASSTSASVLPNDLNAPPAENWPTPSVADDFCPPTFGQRLRHDAGDLWHETLHDYKNYYSWQGLGFLSVGFGIGAIGANTELDQHIRNWYQNSVRSNTSNDIAKVAKMFGEGGYEAPPRPRPGWWENVSPTPRAAM